MLKESEVKLLFMKYKKLSGLPSSFLINQIILNLVFSNSHKKIYYNRSNLLACVSYYLDINKASGSMTG